MYIAILKFFVAHILKEKYQTSFYQTFFIFKTIWLFLVIVQSIKSINLKLFPSKFLNYLYKSSGMLMIS